MLEVKRPTLIMTFHKKSGRFLIRNTNEELVQFPAEERLYEIWRGVFGSVSFFLGSGIESGVKGFYADVETGTKPKYRNRFLEALAAECQVL